MDADAGTRVMVTLVLRMAPARWVVAGRIAALILLGGVLPLCLVLDDRWQRGR